MTIIYRLLGVLIVLLNASMVLDAPTILGTITHITSALVGVIMMSTESVRILK